jgi:hypothetical protein
VPSGALAAIFQPARVTPLSRVRMGTRSSGTTTGSVRPAMRVGAGAVTVWPR